MKLLFDEVWDFIQNGISDDYYIEDDGILDEYVNEDWSAPIEPGQQINIVKDSIWIMYQGEDEDKDHPDREFLSEFKKWKTGLSYTTLVIKVNNKDIDAVLKLLKRFDLQKVN